MVQFIRLSVLIHVVRAIGAHFFFDVQKTHEDRDVLKIYFPEKIWGQYLASVKLKIEHALQDLVPIFCFLIFSGNV